MVSPGVNKSSLFESRFDQRWALIGRLFYWSGLKAVFFEYLDRI